ncbi:MAG: hypothetical protein M0P31_12885 [Solirubrobacteraceae bacterium]|nr:hypothetical protein [Solirubrobacteraceae bacterium]
MSRNFLTSRTMVAIAAAATTAAVAAPMAIGAGEGSDVRAGVRNPTAPNELSNETQIIASNGSFGTRQSNKGTGGGAIYGCRAPALGRGCIEASNLNLGQAFNFRFRGELGGTINTQLSDKTKAKPFTTNATGVATGLNADQVDGKHAEDIVKDSVVAAQATTKMGIVAGDGALSNQRGVTAAAREAQGKYLVTFDADISKCVPTATGYGAAPGANVALEPVDATHLRVHTQTAAGATADRQFALTVTC